MVIYLLPKYAIAAAAAAAAATATILVCSTGFVEFGCSSLAESAFRRLKLSIIELSQNQKLYFVLKGGFS